MIDKKELDSLIYLLDDTDEDVFRQVQTRIIALGNEAIPVLENTLQQDNNPLRLERVQMLIKYIRAGQLVDELKAWNAGPEQDLFKGVLIINRIEYPDIDEQLIENHIDKIKLDAWLELNNNLTSFEKVKVLNYIFFELHGYKGNTEEYHHYNNSFLSKVIETKRGNPIMLATLYSLVAQRLNIPIYGVNLPQHFVLGYRSEDEWNIIDRFNDPSNLNPEDTGDVLFYINPFSEGLILSRDSLKSFLQQLKIDPQPEYLKFCSNKEILKRVIRNLLFSYETYKKEDKIDTLKAMMAALDDSEA